MLAVPCDCAASGRAIIGIGDATRGAGARPQFCESVVPLGHFASRRQNDCREFRRGRFDLAQQSHDPSATGVGAVIIQPRRPARYRGSFDLRQPLPGTLPVR